MSQDYYHIKNSQIPIFLECDYDEKSKYKY